MSSKLSPKTKKTKYSMTKSDVRFYKMSLLFFTVCAVVFFIMKIMESVSFRVSTGKNLSYIIYSVFRHPAYIAVTAALLVASFAWMIFNKIKKKDESMRVISSVNAFVIMLYIAGFSVYYGATGRLLVSESVFVIAVTVVLTLIYYISKIYERDFLAFSIENAVLALLLYKYQVISGTVGVVGKVLLIVAFAAIGFVLVKMFKNGKLSKNQTYLTFPYFVTLAIWAVAMFIPASSGITNGITLTALLVQYIVFAIVYTVKLIKE